MKAVRALGVLVIAVQLVSFVAFALSFSTVFAVVKNISSPDVVSLEMVTDESTGSGELRLEADPRNGGYLGVELTLELSVLDEDDNYIGRNSTLVRLDAGERKTVTLCLHIPADVMQEMTNGGKKSFLEITLRMRTLFNLVGVSNTLRVEGGGP